jgi:hypothetical protein
MRINKNSHKNVSPSMSTKLRGPNFTISLIPAFCPHPLQNGPSITEARVILPNVLLKMLWLFLPGPKGVPPARSLDTREPVTLLYRLY